jgi:hypothetical protein
MKIKKNTFCSLVLELFFPSTANWRKLKIQKNPKIDFPYCTVHTVYPPNSILLGNIYPGKCKEVMPFKMAQEDVPSQLTLCKPLP